MRLRQKFQDFFQTRLRNHAVTPPPHFFSLQVNHKSWPGFKVVVGQFKLFLLMGEWQSHTEESNVE